ncbi:ATP-binding protein [Streptomyces sp. NPDC101151]|uniref:ATP-binding protein n=1 Tax=Streptomyces sp. NPDC101151 TaxID=3366115 RepID=UPI0037F53E1B
MDPVVLAVVSSSLISSLATEAWRQVRDNVVTLVRNVRPEQAQTVATELDRTHEQMVVARRTGDRRLEQELTIRWLGRLHTVLGSDDTLDAASQQQLLLGLLLTARDQARAGELIAGLVEPASPQLDLPFTGRLAEAATLGAAGLARALPAGTGLGQARTLPRDIPLAGRDEELSELLSVLPARDAREAPVCLVHGMPGSGKTALAVHVAHRLADAFPDGQIFINLAAHSLRTDEALAPSLVLETLLKTAGVPRSVLPRSVDGQASMWRSWLSPRRVLLVLDDAADLEQIEPILPGDSACLTIVTSRLRLDAPLLTRSIDLGPLDPEPAAQMFESLILRRTHVDGPAAQAVARLCGHLPVAITAAASELLRHPTWRTSDLLRELGVILGSSGAVRARPAPEVGAVFRSSYRQLEDQEQEFLQRLSLHPGTELEPYAAAALAETSVDRARETLNSLYLRSLLSEVRPGRFRMHELLHAFVERQLDSARDGAALRAATSRLLHFYRDSAARAYALGSGESGAATPEHAPQLQDATQAAGWLRQEAENLAAAAQVEAGQTSTLLAELLTAGLLQGGNQELELARRLLSQSAEQAADEGRRLTEALFRYQLGLVAVEAGEPETANEQMSRALALHRAQGTRDGEARALYGLGLARHVAGHTEEAAGHLAHASSLFHELGTDLDEANSLYESGAVHATAGRVGEALQLLEQAQIVYRNAAASSADTMGARLLPRDWAHQLRELTERLSAAQYAPSASEHAEHDGPTWVTLPGTVLHHPSAIAPRDDAAGGVGGGGDGGGPGLPAGPSDPFDEDGDESAGEGERVCPEQAEEDVEESQQTERTLSPAERESVEGQHINFWFSDPEVSDEAALYAGHCYQGCFQVGPDDPRNRAVGERLVPSADIPPSGLPTRWVVYSTTAALKVPADAGYTAQAFETLAGDRSQWIIEFDLVIPTVGQSEERPITITPQAPGDVRITADLYVGQDRYRQLSIDITAQDPPRPRPAAAPDPHHSPTSDAPASSSLPHARPAVEASPAGPMHALKPNLPPDSAPAAAAGRRGLRLQDRRVMPVGQTALRSSHIWHRPARTLTLTLMPPKAKWTLEIDGRPNSSTSRWIDWNPGAETGQWVTKTQHALDAVRELCGTRYNSIASQDVSDRLKRFQPSEAWLEPSQHFSEHDEAFWTAFAAEDAARQLAYAGHKLLHALFPRDSELHQRIVELEPGSKLHVDWRSRDQDLFHVPWQLLYRSQPPGFGQAINANDFLGLRLRLSNLTYDLNEEVSRALDRDATRAHLLYWGQGDSTAQTVEEHKQELSPWSPLFLPTEDADRRAQLSEFLHAPAPSPVSLVYIFCQGTNDADTPLRFGCTNKREDMLALADMGMSELEDHPLIFVNACESSSVEYPFSNTLQHSFMERGSRAYIGGECRVPTAFAARFASVFFHFLYSRISGDSPTSAGEAMSQSRKFFWDEYRSIGGLFYSYVNDYELFVAGPAEVEKMHQAPAITLLPAT